MRLPLLLVNGDDDDAAADDGESSDESKMPLLLVMLLEITADGQGNSSKDAESVVETPNMGIKCIVASSSSTAGAPICTWDRRRRGHEDDCQNDQ
ncbi:hypothetical protein ACLKA7_000146 [Drosophila subpalustris]